VVALLGALLYLFSDIFIMLGVSVLLALLLNPVVTYLERRYFNRSNSTLIVFFGLITVLYIFIWHLVPNFLSQLNSLANILSQLNIREYIIRQDEKIAQLFPFVNKGMISARFDAFVRSAVNSSFDSATGIVTNFFTILAIVIIIPFTTFFVVKDKQLLVKAVLNLVPNRYFEMSYWVIKKITGQLSNYVRGWLLDALFVGTVCGVGFWFIGLDNALALGILAGVGHLVPYFGPLIGGVPAMAISTIQFGNFSMLPLIILILVLVYISDNGFVQPYVFSKSVNMHPLMIILLIVAGSQVAGVFGMLLAVPLATVFKTAAKEIYLGIKNYKITRR